MFCKPPHPVYIVLFRGDDTDFVGNQEIIVKITTERNISGCKAYFKYMGNIQTFDEIPENKELHLVFSHEQTKEMPLGTWDAELYLIDENGKRMTVNNRIHMLVTNSVGEAYCPDDPQAVSVVISANKYIEDAEVSADGKTLTLTKKDGTEVSFSGGGGGGTNDYNDLENKPSINGATLTGNVNLATPEQLLLKADKSALDNHEGNTNNPHKVTAAQVGAVQLVEDVNREKTAVTIGSRSGTVGPYSLANGMNVTASGNYSHAEGAGSTSSGYFSHAEGNNTTASGAFSHAEGEGTTASGNYSHARGNGTKANGNYSKADGINSQTKETDYYSFAWNGDGTRSESYYSHGKGTFNINPVGGTDGIYIGEKKLSEVISDGVANKADKATTLAGYGITDAATKTELNAKADKSALAAKADKATTLAGYGITDGATKKELAALTAKVEYPLYAVPSTGVLKDRAINTTSLATVTVPENFTDLLIRASVTSSLSVTMPDAIATKYGDTFPGEAGEYLITITKTGAAEAYVRTIKLEVANA